MYTGFLHLHNTLRWLVLVVALITLAKYFMAWFSHNRWKKSDNLLGVIFTAVMDVQLVVGLALYFFISPITKAAFQNIGAAFPFDACCRGVGSYWSQQVEEGHGTTKKVWSRTGVLLNRIHPFIGWYSVGKGYHVAPLSETKQTKIR